jgi:hypothetical protein
MADHIKEKVFIKYAHEKYCYGIDWRQSHADHLPLLSSVWEVQSGLVVHAPGENGAAIPTPDTEITVNGVDIAVWSGQITDDDDYTTIWLSGGVKNGGRDGYTAINHVVFATGEEAHAPLRIKVI